MLTYQFAQSETTLDVQLTGNLTAANVPEFQQAIRQFIANGVTNIVIDSSQLVSVDSTGIGLLIAIVNTLNPKNGKLRLLKLPKEIFKLLQSMRLTSRLEASAID